MKKSSELYFNQAAQLTDASKDSTEMISANDNLLSNLNLKTHSTHNLFDDLEEEEKILESMEHADGRAA